MLTVRTRSRSPISKEFWKYTVATMLKRTRGPYAVRDSLIRGLKELHIPYELNPRRSDSDPTLVLSGTGALTEACKAKRSDSSIRLLAGPNITVSPNDNGAIVKSKEIDIILVPAPWVRDAWTKIAPDLSDKIRIWASGTAKAAPSDKSGGPIIYRKNCDISTLALATEKLQSLGLNPIVFEYGNFAHDDFISSLSSATFMVYLGGTESQGLGLQEAWARDVPTFVRSVDVYKTDEVEIRDPGLAAPYLTDETGAFFKHIDELESLISRKDRHTPARYHDEHLSDEAATRKLMSIIDEIDT